jgi:hypothetical protein
LAYQENNKLDVKENYKHDFDFALDFPLGGMLLCLRTITVNPALVISDNTGQEGCIVGGDLTKLLADGDTLRNCEITSGQIYDSK